MRSTLRRTGSRIVVAGAPMLIFIAGCGGSKALKTCADWNAASPRNSTEYIAREYPKLPALGPSPSQASAWLAYEQICRSGSADVTLPLPPQPTPT